MGARHLTRLALASAACTLLAACGSSAPAEVSTPTAAAARDPDPGAPRGRRSGCSTGPSSGWTRSAATSAKARRASPPRTSAHLRRVHGDARRNRRLLADLPARRARRRRPPTTWSSSRRPTGRRSRSTPTAAGRCGRSPHPATRGWAGSSQITTTSPIADPDRRFVYAASPNGLIHKLVARDGQRGLPGPGR